MQKPTISTGNKGQMVVTDHEGKVKEFAVKDTGDAVAAFNAAMAAFEAASAPAEIKAALTYRDELTIIGPNGFPVITGTRDTFDWLGRHFAAIMATYEANAGKVAEDYSKRKKALGKEVPNNDPRRAKTPLPIVTGK